MEYSLSGKLSLKGMKEIQKIKRKLILIIVTNIFVYSQKVEQWVG